MGNFRRKSRSSRPESKNSKRNWKPNELPELRSKNNDLNSPENSKSSPNDLKKLVAPPPLRSSSTNDEKPKWPNSDETWKNPTWLTNPPPLLFERSKPTRLLNCPKPSTTFSESNKSS